MVQFHLVPLVSYFINGQKGLAEHKHLIRATEKHSEFRQTYHSGPATRFSIYVLVAQVEHECCSAVKQGQHPNTDIKLCWGCMVSSQVVNGCGHAIVFAVRNIIGNLRQPVKTRNIFNYYNLKSQHTLSCKPIPHCKGVRVFADTHLNG